MSQEKSKEISIVKYLPRQPELIHAPYIPEMDFYMAVKAGDVRKVKELCEEPFHEKEGLGLLSKDPLRNMKYHFAISAALIARMCIEGGMPMSEAYSISDYYIKAGDGAGDIETVSELHDEMSLSYTSRMRQLYREKVYSRPVSECIDYILEHLDTRIKMEDLSLHTSLSAAYISRLFKEETGMTVTDYILQRKLETACNMLDFSSYPITWIASTLAFPSESYFCKVFKARFGISPGKYRKEGAVHLSEDRHYT